VPEDKNGIIDIKKYLSTPERPVDSKEMSDFWNSLTDEEKKEFKNAELN
jgi:hypothetical protein